MRCIFFFALLAYNEKSNDGVEKEVKIIINVIRSPPHSDRHSKCIRGLACVREWIGARVFLFRFSSLSLARAHYRPTRFSISLDGRVFFPLRRSQVVISQSKWISARSKREEKKNRWKRLKKKRKSRASKKRKKKSWKNSNLKLCLANDDEKTVCCDTVNQ